MHENQNKILPIHKVVLDTNILVSSLMSTEGNPSSVIELVKEQKIKPYYNSDILDEYKRVLHYPKFNFVPHLIDNIFNKIVALGMPVEYVEESTMEMIDESDRKFYDLHKAADAILITGNIRHFPEEASIMKPADFLDYFARSDDEWPKDLFSMKGLKI